MRKQRSDKGVPRFKPYKWNDKDKNPVYADKKPAPRLAQVKQDQAALKAVAADIGVALEKIQSVKPCPEGEQI